MQKVVSALKQVLENTVANPLSPLHDVKTVFFGDPVLIPEDNLPALIVHPVRTDYTMRGSLYDQKVHSILVSLVYNQKMYFDKGIGTPKSITAAVYATWSITFTAPSHGITIWKTVHIENMKPEAYNGTFVVSGVTADTFTVSKLTNPWPATSLGVVKLTTTDKVYAVEDALVKVEKQGEYHETAALSVCGTIQQNSSLPFVDAEGNRTNTAELSKVLSVEYAFNLDRGFPTFEVKTNVEVTCIGDR